MKHTPGPWKAFGTDIRGLDMESESALAHAFGLVSGTTMPNDRTAKANALLIAAAPDLLEALAEYVTLGAGKCTISKAHADKGLAALHKAQGK